MSLPEKLLLRRGEVMAALGLSKRQFRKLVEARVLVPRYLTEGADGEKSKGHAKAFYTRAAVLKLVERVNQ